MMDSLRDDLMTQINLLMSGLMVREEVFTGQLFDERERPATVEEVRQFIVEAYQILGTFGYVYADKQKTLFIKENND